ncbi:MAG: tetratricopeptide repeat protein [Nitrospinae bacterium]|nr:tetratricopeptide repeat protein [Nitrospinota bacterium]MBL7019025.1 tetratricopeptide repeat protein [Nitrospinaceae bacterium]
MKNNFIILLACLLAGCSGYLPAEKTRWPINQEERHSWYPPDETVLSARRSNQLWLDALTLEIEILFVNHASFSNRELALFESINQIDSQTNTMNSNYGKQIESERERKIRMQKDLEMSKVGFIAAGTKLKELMAVKPPVIFSIADYNSAMKSFRDGQFDKSLKLFLKLNKQKPPLFLQDNIQFGLGSVYYRLKNYPKATIHFQKILDDYARGDKRFVSYFMLGIIHNLQGDKSRAVYLLEEALSKNPPEKMKNGIHRLINVINDEPSHAAS